MSKKFEDTYNLLEIMTSNNCQWHGDRNQPRKIAKVYEIDGLSLVNAKLDSLTKKVEKINIAAHPLSVFSCKIYRGGHSTMEYQ